MGGCLVTMKVIKQASAQFFLLFFHFFFFLSFVRSFLSTLSKGEEGRCARDRRTRRTRRDYVAGWLVGWLAILVGLLGFIN